MAAGVVLWAAALGLVPSWIGAQTFDVLHLFDGSDGYGPLGFLIEASDGVLYGTTYQGGANHDGVVFKLNKDGTGFLKLHDFLFSDAGLPHAGLVEASDGALYGTTQHGGTNGQGTVFKLNKDGTGFLKLHDFDRSDPNNGANPLDGLVEGSDGSLYGTAFNGGVVDGGVAFKLNKDGTGFQKLHDFGTTDGSNPNGLIEASDGVLYGTTNSGGAEDDGVVFKLNEDGTGFLKLHDFNRSDPDDGATPYAGVVEASDGVLYGTTVYGGAEGYGVVFKLNKDGNNFLKLHDFNRSDPNNGEGAEAGVVEASNGALYGTTYTGGAFNVGIIFKLNKDGSGFLNLHDFNGSEGAFPEAGLVEASDGAFYGNTFKGGLDDAGVIFRLAVRCEASVQVQGDVNTAGTTVPVQIHIAHHRPKTVTVRWKLSLLNTDGQLVAEHISPPHTFEPGDVLGQEVKFQLPDELASGEYTLDLAIKQMAGTKGAKTTLRVVRAE